MDEEELGQVARHVARTVHELCMQCCCVLGKKIFTEISIAGLGGRITLGSKIRMFL